MGDFLDDWTLVQRGCRCRRDANHSRTWEEKDGMERASHRSPPGSARTQPPQLEGGATASRPASPPLPPIPP